MLVPATDLAIRGLGVQRGYWVALTILVVLRPDFAGTFQRSLMRVIGTIVGLLLALLVGGLVGFNAFRSHMIAQFFANNKPPPATVTVLV